MIGMRTAMWGMVLVPVLVLSALAGGLTGKVTDKVTGEPLPTAVVSVLDADGHVVAGVRTDANGRFRLPEALGPGTTLQVSLVGYVTAQVPAATGPGAGETVVALDRQAYIISPVIVTAARSSELSFNTPASVTVTTPADAEIRQEFTPTDALRSVLGASFSRKGLVSSTFGLRGAAGVVNGSVLVLQDWRYTRLPAFAYFLPYMLTAAPADIDRIEVVRGPVGVIYGPESGPGVVHVLTRSPFDYQGASASIGLGERNVREGWARYSGLASSRVGFQASFRFFGGKDWTPEPADAAAVPIGDLQQVIGQASLEWRPGDESRVVLTGGGTRIRSLLEQFPTNYVRMDQFGDRFLQARYHRRQAMVNVVYNENLTGKASFIGSGGAPVVENSRMWIAQVQDARQVGWAGVQHQIAYGLDLRTTVPRTEGTLTGRFEDDDTVTQVGAFFQTDSAVSSRLDLVGALRFDYHDRMETGLAVPFQAGAVFRPHPDHALRLVVGHQASATGAGFLFQDSPVRSTPFFDIYWTATPPHGWNFRRDDAGNLAMRSRFVPGGVDAFVAADAALTWQAMQALVPELAGVPAPGSGQVGTNLGRLNLGTGAFDPVSPADVKDAPPNDRTYTDRLELGYKSYLGDRMVLDATAFGTRYEHVGKAPAAAIFTPSVFYDRATLEAYLGSYLTPAQAQTVAAAMAEIPVGTVEPSEAGASDNLILGSGQATGSYTQWGADLGVEYVLASAWILRTDYSWCARQIIDFGDGFVRPSGIPKHRGRVGLEYDRGGAGFTGLIEFRAQTEYEMALHAWSGRLPGRGVWDLGVGYRTGGLRNLSAFLTATNVFDRRYVEVVGAKKLGRLVMLRLQMDL